MRRRSIDHAKIQAEIASRRAAEPPRLPPPPQPRGAPTMRCRFLQRCPDHITFRDGVVYFEECEFQWIESRRTTQIFQARKVTASGVAWTMEVVTTDSFALQGILYRTGFLMRKDEIPYRLVDCLVRLGFMQVWYFFPKEAHENGSTWFVPPEPTSIPL